MRVHDSSARATNQSAQCECGDHIELAVRREPHNLDASVGGTPRQLILSASDDDRAVAAIAHPGRQPQNLTLAAAPATLRIDVQDRQQAGVPREVIS